MTGQDEETGQERLARLGSAFLKLSQEKIDREKRLHVEIAKLPECQMLTEPALEAIAKVERRLERIRLELCGFLERILGARYAEELDEIDGELARREATFRKLLFGYLRESWLIPRLIRAKGEVSHLETRLGFRSIHKNSMSIAQLAAEGGFLIDVRDEIVPYDTRSIDRELASATERGFRYLRWQGVKMFFWFLVRWLIDLVRRHAIAVGVALVLMAVTGAMTDGMGFGWRTLGAFIIGIAGLIAEWTFARLFDETAKEMHRRYLWRATHWLYLAYVDVTLGQAALDAAQKTLEKTEAAP
jgi:hypothetical protein